MPHVGGLHHATATHFMDDDVLCRLSTLDIINEGLTHLTYTPPNDYSGEDTVRIFVSDLGNNGAGGPFTAEVTLTVRVVDVNDAPSLTFAFVDGYVSTPENQDIDLTRTLQLTVSDVDAGRNETIHVQIEVESSGGTIDLVVTENIRLIQGTGTNDALVEFEGTLKDINIAMRRLVYRPGQDFSGYDTLHLSISDEHDATATEFVPVSITPRASKASFSVPESIRNLVSDEDEEVMLPGISVIHPDNATYTSTQLDVRLAAYHEATLEVQRLSLDADTIAPKYYLSIDADGGVNALLGSTHVKVGIDCGSGVEETDKIFIGSVASISEERGDDLHKSVESLLGALTCMESIEIEVSQDFARDDESGKGWTIVLHNARHDFPKLEVTKTAVRGGLARGDWI